MKELSIEEKAKAYDEAIGRARKELDACGSQDCDAARQIFRLFPELKESEDEEIKNAIIKHFENLRIGENLEKFYGVDIDTILTWLEKQGKHANFINKIQIGDKVTRNRDGALVNLSQLNRVAKKDEKRGEQKFIWHNEDEEPQKDSLILLIMQSGTPIVAKIIEPNHTFNHGERWAYIDDLLEKQGEQPQGKSALEAAKEEKIDNANKAEPKFKVGDWICHTVYKKPLLIIEDLGEGDFRTEPKSIITAKEFREGVFRLWAIQDAEDGDVLALDTWTFIFKKYQDKSVYYHCAVSTFNNFSISDTGEFDSNYVHPATKEQRDLLFQKMKNAGYTFDFEKKELKKN